MLFHATCEICESYGTPCQKMCGAQDTFPAPSGSKAAALAQNRMSTKHRTLAHTGHQRKPWQAEGTGTGRDTAVEHPPRAPASVDGVSALQNAL